MGKISRDLMMCGLFMMLVAIAAIAVAGSLWGYEWYGGDTIQQMGTEACHEAFNESFDYQGWSGTYPPSIQCNGPNGYLGTAPMPEKMQEQLKIVTPERHE